MTADPGLSISLRTARRLAVTKQHLGGSRPTPGSDIVSVVRDLAYVQWDPVAIVAPSHLLSLWNRVDRFRPSDLERLLWREKRLFEHWMPIASIVLTEDYPLYRSLMRRFPDSLSDSWGVQREAARAFLASHVGLRRRLLAELAKGPRTIGEIEAPRRSSRDGHGWEPASEVAEMLTYLSMSGDAMVVGHAGNQNVWGLSGAFLPEWVDRRALSETVADEVAAQRAIRALGTASPREIHLYFVRGRYRHLPETLARLEEKEAIRRVSIEGSVRRETRYIHRDDLPLLPSLETDDFPPRLSLLPPFDNVVSHPERTRRIFGFEYVREQFLPPERRRYGRYVLSILWGDRMVGRIDPRMDRARGTLDVGSVHAEPGAPRDREFRDALRGGIERLARFVGAERVHIGSRVPPAWASIRR